MPFDGLTIRALCKELNSQLLNARIDKIHQPEKDELVLLIRQAKTGNTRLVLSANARWARMHISSEKKANPSQAPAFCMLLRKHLDGGKIKEIKQLGMERIVYIRIEALDDFRDWKEKVLICEFMGRHSNIVLINPETQVIVDAIKKFGNDINSYREILPGKEYISPPSQGKLNPETASFEDFVARIWHNDEDITLSTALFKVFTGISPFSAKEICLAVNLDPDIVVSECGEYELSKIYTCTKDLIESIDEGRFDPFVQFNKKLPLDFAPYQMLSLSASSSSRSQPSMNAACDSYFASKLQLIRLDSMKTNLSRKVREKLDKAYRKRDLQSSDLTKAEENEKYRLWGELLTAYAHQYKKGDKEAVLDDFYSDGKITLSLDPRYTPIENAQLYFKIYNKSRGARKHLQTRMAENEQEIDYLESVLLTIQQAESPAEINEIVEELEKGAYLKSHGAKDRKKPERSQPRRFISSDGLEIMVGRNNRQNDWLSLKESERHDLWLHTKDIPGSHVIIRLPRTYKSIFDIPDKSLEEAASLAAYYSKGRESDKVQVDYTFRTNVKKPSAARPGMVIYDNYWTIMVNPRDKLVEDLLNQQEL